jgi:hypothetical protein
MPKWIRKIKHDTAGFRVAVPMVIVHKLGWKNCKYVTIESFGEIGVIIRRMPGDDRREPTGSKHSPELD